MSIEIIDLLKPKNGLSFKLIEDVDIAVQGYESLADAVSHFVTLEGIQQIINAALSGKQDKLTTEQLAACNSGITSELVAQIALNTTAIAGKAAQSDLTALQATVNGKANTADLTALSSVVATKANSADVTTSVNNLQGQIDAISQTAGTGTADTEIAQARVGVDGTTYNTLKVRLDAEANHVQKIESDNLFDKRRLFVGHLNGDYDNILNWAGYRYSDYIKTTATKIYFNQCPNVVYFYLNGAYVGSYAGANLTQEDDWYVTPTFATAHDGFAFDFLADSSAEYYCDPDTLMASLEILPQYEPYTGKILIYGDENASLFDLNALRSSINSDLTEINGDIDTLEDSIDEINENVLHYVSPNILDPNTVLTKKALDTVKGTYTNSGWASSCQPISAKKGDVVYFNFKPYALYCWNNQNTFIGNKTEANFVNDGNGWYHTTLGWNGSDSFAVMWDNISAGFSINTSMITLNGISSEHAEYGVDYPELFGERIARYDELPVLGTTKCTVLPGESKKTNKRIGNTLSVGDTIELVSINWRAVTSCEIPKGAIGIYVSGTNDKTYPKYAIVDKDSKILKLAALDADSTGDNYGYYINITDVNEPYMIYFECSSNSGSMTLYWEYSKSDFNIYGGEKVAATFSSASETKELANDMPVMVREFDDSDKTETITFSSTQYCRNIGLWLKLADYSSISDISNIRVSLYMNNDLATTDEAEEPQFLQMGNWVFLKVRTMDYAFNKITITVNLSDATKTVYMEIGAYPIKNHFNRPIMSINFDQTWQATADCGAYDDLIDNGIPFTITGNISHYLEKITAENKKGLLDIGSYAGASDGTAIVNTMTLSEMLSALDSRIDAKVSEGFGAPTSFGGGGHVIDPKLRRALDISGFTAVKGGSLGGVNSVTCENPKYIYIGCNADLAMTLGGVYFMFAHGISSNPSGESNPSMYMSYTDFTSILNAIIANVNSGGAIVLNMKQYSEFMSKNKLIG